MLKSAISILRAPLVERVCCQSTLTHQQISILPIVTRLFHLTSYSLKDDKRNQIRSMPRRDEGTHGEIGVEIENSPSKSEIFPDENLPNRLFNGIPFKEIPIINVKCSKNNTLISLTDHEGVVQLYHTCGAEGFTGARRATNVAAQATAISLSTKALEKGFQTVRVRVRGLGPGRMASLKGLQMGGMDIISVTDNTRVTWTPLRPRKARRV
ncbi:28S ribosomal protein S11, mitochondrial [Fopius arisanus]|uniref:28S ribosomal protein S11, mitochondrial n=1 Tax=Fopius arisanus TaxID=64838 RepID=A0A0C9QE12_9HYME|nr:PREDICTED: 28S ribosomal protein S11, mitochondrial-like [Fopius arisanus]